jgi:hypothetical protein
VCVLDPIKSDWWGVISSADGKRPGLPFNVLGGPHGHVPLHSGAGAAIGELVATGKLPLSVLDMADFEPGGQHRFFVAFADTLIKKMRGALYLVLEEAHEFAPKERAGFEKENLAIHFAKKLATAGRSKGIRLVLMTQRTQALHNAMLGSCETMIVHRLTAPADQEPVLKWLKANVTDKDVRASIAESMSSLKTGTGWLCSGEARIFKQVAFPRISTFDNSATPTGDAGELAVRSADVDFENLRALIGTAVNEAEANDPKKLKARIAELEREVKQAPTLQAVSAAGAVAMKNARIARLEDDNRALEQHRDELVQAFRKLRQQATSARDILMNDLALIEPTFTKPSVPAPAASPRLPSSKPAAVSAPRPRANGDASLTKGQRVVLTAIAQSGDVDPEQLTVLTGYKRSSRDTYLQQLRSAGYVNDGWPANATPAGMAALGDFEPLPTGAELRDHWLTRLGGGERTILEVLVKAYPNGVTREQIDNATGYQRSSRDTYLQKLGARKLVEKRGGSVFASERLF